MPSKNYVMLSVAFAAGVLIGIMAERRLQLAMKVADEA